MPTQKPDHDPYGENLGDTMDKHCKQCGYLVVTGSPSSDKDVLAQVYGYCSDVCRRIYQEEKAYVIEKERAKE